MKKMLIMAGGIMLSSLLAGGCWATMGNVKQEISKSQADVIKDQDQKTDTKITNLDNKINVLNKKLDELNEGQIKTNTANLYKLQMDFNKATEDLNKEMKELSKQVAENNYASKDQVTELLQKYLSACNVLIKTLKAQREGMDSAVNELEKITILTPEGGPTSPEQKSPEGK